MLPGKAKGVMPRTNHGIFQKIRKESYASGRDLSYDTLQRVVRLFFGAKVGIAKLMKRKRIIHIKGLGTFEKEKAPVVWWKKTYPKKTDNQ